MGAFDAALAALVRNSCTGLNAASMICIERRPTFEALR